MSEVRVTSLKDSSGSNTSSTSDIRAGRSKAWVYFTNTSGTPSIQNSFNVNSITDSAVGKYVLNFSPAMGSSNYVVLGDCADAVTSDQVATCGNSNYTPSRSTTTCRVMTNNFVANAQDKDHNFFTVLDS